MSSFDTIHGAPHNPNNPFQCCFECPDRHPACADHCEKHAEAKRKNEEKKRLQRLDKALRDAGKVRALRQARQK